jgi:hypothetical protein
VYRVGGDEDQLELVTGRLGWPAVLAWLAEG